MNRQLLDNYVMKIIEHKSLTQAARMLGISQPALSQGLNALEKEIGIKIFNRRANPITLTSEGEIYVDYIRRQRSLEADFDKRLKDHRSAVSGSVEIGAPFVYVNSLVVPAVSKLLKEHPEYSITIRSGAMDELIEMMNISKLDCFISTSHKLPEQFEVLPICQEEICLCLPTESELSRKIEGILQAVMLEKAIDPDDPQAREKAIEACLETRILPLIDGEPFILLDEDQPIQLLMDRYLADLKISPSRHLTVDQVSVALRLASEGVGCCFASREAVEDTGLNFFPIPGTRRTIYMAYDREHFLTQACKELMKLMG